MNPKTVDEAALQVLLAYIARVKEPTELFEEGPFARCIEKIWPRIVKTLSDEVPAEKS